MSIKRSKEVNKHLSNIEAAKDFFEEMQSTRQESFDNKSEKWQEGEKGAEEQENLDAIEEIVSSLDDTHTNIDNLFEEL